jgi:hypothetical protein
MSASAPPRPPRERRRGGPHLWSALSTAQKRTAAAAVLLLLSLGTPWYATEVVFRARPGEQAPITHGTMSGFSAFSFVEAAVLLVAVAVLVLTWARATDRAFSLPGRDGTFVTIAAGWIGLLVVYRLFDRPEGQSTPSSTTLIGLSWGIFASLVAVGLLLATGLDQRRAVPSRRETRGARDEGPVVDPADVVRPRAGDEDVAWSDPGPRDRAADGRPREERARDRPVTPGRTPRRPAGHEDDTRFLGRDDAAALLRDSGLSADAPARTPSRDDGAPTRAVRPDDAPTRAVRGDAPAPEDPTRAVHREEDPTRAVRRDEDPTRAVRREEDPTRAAPPREDAPPADDATRVHRRGFGRGRP